MRQTHRHRQAIQGIRAAKVSILIALLLSLGACTSNWKAPLEDRTSGRAGLSQPSKQAPLSPQQTRYKVRPGDTLYAIAWRSDNDFRQVARWNNIRPPYTIYAGQWLRLQPPAESVRKPAPTQRPQPSPRHEPKRPPKAKPQPQQEKPKARQPEAKPKQPPAKDTAKGFKQGPLRWRWPHSGPVRSSYRAGDRLRKGIKLAGREGDAILAAESGKVVYSGSGLIGYGQLIIVKHNDKYLSAYGHNRKLLVKQGQSVTKGQKIAEMGLSNDGKPLLHFEIRRNGKPVNPSVLLPRR